jgi:proteasome lid subunit RPN8/RPN11
MVTGNGGDEFGCWRVEGQPLVVEYSRAVLEALRKEVVEAFHKLARGGLEVGGVLFGKRSGNTMRILASRPLACEHATGPGFALSERDEAALRQLAESAATDPDLAGMAAVGWYHSHTRSGLFLSEEDVGIWNRHFPEPWQAALVLHPEKMKPTRAAFFFREAGGAARTDPGQLEFEVEPLRRQRTAAQPTPERAPQEDVAAPPPPFVAPRTTGRLSWFLFALAWCIAAGSLAYALRDYWLPKPPAPATPPVKQAAPPIDPEKERMVREIEQLRADLDREIKLNSELQEEIAAPKKSPKKRK